MARLTALIALAVLAVLAAAAPAPAAKQRCTFKGARTVAANDQVRVFWVKGRGADQRVYFGCRRNRRPILLGADRLPRAEGEPRTLNGTFRLAGTWVAWRQTSDDNAYVVVRSLAGAARAIRQDVSRYELRNLRVGPDGAVAWILAVGDFREVGGVAASTTVPSVIAVAEGIDSETLTLRGDRVGYRAGGAARSGRLRRPARPAGGNAIGPQGLDGRFGDCGTLVPATPKAGVFTEASELARAPGDAIVAAGTTTSEPASDDAERDTFVVARLAGTGRFDAGFGRSGVVQVRVPRPAGARDAALTGLAVQPDGRIVVAGHVALAADGAARSVLMRFDTSGRLDPTFGNGGVVRDAIAATAAARVEDVAATASGALLVTGQRDGRWFVARLAADGSLDETFGERGIVADPGSGASRLAALAVAEDGTIVAAGGSGTPLLLRLTPDGAILSITSQGPPAYSSLVAVQTTADGGAIAVGTGGDVRDPGQALIARYGPDGKPARGFDRDGFVLDTQIFDPRDVAVAPSGSILITARFALEPGDHNGDGLVRYTSTGTRDRSFGLRGVLGGTSSFGLTHHAILVGADGTAHVAQDNAGAFAISRFAVAAPATAATHSRSAVCAMATALKIGPAVRSGKLDVSLRLRAPGKVRLDAVIEVDGRRIPAGTVTVFRPYTEGAVATIPLNKRAVAQLRKAATAELTIAGGAPGKATTTYTATLSR